MTYRSLRRNRRKVPTICPSQRDNRKRARVCGGADCELVAVLLTGMTDDTNQLTLLLPTGEVWPGPPVVTVTVNGTPNLVISVTALGDEEMQVSLTNNFFGTDIVIVTAEAPGSGMCPFAVWGVVE